MTYIDYIKALVDFIMKLVAFFKNTTNDGTEN